MYDIDAHLAEIYVKTETYKDEVQLIHTLINGRGPLRILEPFCGTGRILIPFAQDGLRMMGKEQFRFMLARA